MSKVEISVGVAGTGSFTLDDHDIGGAIVGFDLDSRVGRTPTIRLDLGCHGTYITGEFDVRMSDGTYRMLCQAGWTPPERGVRIALESTPVSSVSEPMPAELEETP